MVLPRTILEPDAIGAFADDARAAVYACIALRRDIRQFERDRVVEEAVLARILGAAHEAPSVGFGQPWGFVLVRDRGVRVTIRESFLRCREAESLRFPEERRAAYLAHPLEGILEAPLNVCVTVDLRDRGEAILGTTAQPEAVRASVCAAVQNLWLAARAEGVGVGWVSIVEPAVLRRELGLPAGVEPVAYLCVGHPVAFRKRPMLEETGWLARKPLEEVIHASGRWEERGAALPAAPLPRSLPPLDPLSVPLGRTALGGPELSAGEAARRHSATLTKPVGSLGRLEDLASWYASVRGAFPPPRIRGAVALFAADHGVVSEGVSAYSSTITAAMVANVMAGGAAISVLAREHDLPIALTDVGVAGDLSGAPTSPVTALRRRKVRAGTGNLFREPAMLREEALAAMEAGAELSRELARAGINAIALGEIGIGNTTAAAALTAVFTGRRPREVVGAGTGVAGAVLAHKLEVVEAALALHRPDASDPIGVVAALGGLEIAALVGCTLEAARLRVAVVLDGFVTNAAALVAARIEPAVGGYLLAAHTSTEPGVAHALAHLGLLPLFDLGLRLGEGTGAVLGLTLLRSAVHTQLAMATFATAGIVGRAGTSESSGQ